MANRIEDYALIGDTETVALVARDGSIDWLCLPRFDSGACFASLLGTPDNGRWLLAPDCRVHRVTRRYLPRTLVLETRFETEHGVLTITDCMPPRSRLPDVVRVVKCENGRVPVFLELKIRFDYGSVRPWVRSNEGRLHAIAGPDGITLDTAVPLDVTDGVHAHFTLEAGEEQAFVLFWYPSHEPPPPPLDPRDAVSETARWWREWIGQCKHESPWTEAVERSLMVLKALTFRPTGGIVAAATTSLPEWIGSVRNWDYRYSWLRDATFTLDALMDAGFVDEARLWRDWLVRAVAGDPSQLQIMYGVAGERRLSEYEVPWLPGYEGSRPVRVGNAASGQFQLDVYGEVIDALFQAERHGIACDPETRRLQHALMEFVAGHWQEPDEGLWEIRGPRRHFVHSKVMAWVAVDRTVRAIEQFGVDGPLADWRALRDRIHADVCVRGYNVSRGAFVQSYDSGELDASLLMIPLVGFLPVTDPRVAGTIDAIARELMKDGFVRRYDTSSDVDGLPPGEGVFLMCTFWLADCYALLGRRDEALAIFEKLLALRNDVGLLSEEYDPAAGRLLGNFPQAFSHVSLVNTASRLAEQGGAAEARAQKPA